MSSKLYKRKDMRSMTDTEKGGKLSELCTHKSKSSGNVILLSPGPQEMLITQHGPLTFLYFQKKEYNCKLFK